MMFYFFSVLLIILLGISVKRKGDFLGKETTDTLKGFLMLLIVFHHILNMVGYPKNFEWLFAIGFLSTGLFFFISGYGNWISFQKSDKTSITWLTSRVKRLYQSFLSCFILMVICMLIAGNYVNVGYDFSAKHILKDIVTFSLPNTINWFPKVFLICIIVFFIIGKIFKNELIRLILLVILTIVYMVICIKVLNLETYWYNSVACFTLGCIIAKYRFIIDRIEKLIKNKSKILVVLMVLIFTVLSAFLLHIVKYSNRLYFIQPIYSLFVCIIFACATFFLSFENSFMKFCGKYSFEIYLFHTIFLKIIFLFRINTFVYAILVYTGTLMCIVIYAFVKEKKYKKWHTLKHQS